MWEATGPDGERAFLFGTIHSLPDGADWRTPALVEAIAASEILLVEIANLDDSDSAEREFFARAYDLEPVPLLDRVPAADRAALAAALDLAEIDPDSMIHTENWAAALQLGNAKRCTSSQNGVDRALLDAVPDVRSLESFAEQFAIFDALPDAAQADLLMSVANERGCAAGEERVMAWLTGDLAALEASITQGFRGNADLQSRLLDRRNANYVADIVALHAERPDADLLVAVGTGHMLGDSGVPALLAAQGYTVRRIQ
nr:TraB/GumN family protein [Erythrobacter sp. EC-HK427]